MPGSFESRLHVGEGGDIVGGRGTNLLPENASFRSKACWREFFGKFNWAAASPSPCVYWAVKFARLTKPMV